MRIKRNWDIKDPDKIDIIGSGLANKMLKPYEAWAYMGTKCIEKIDNIISVIESV